MRALEATALRVFVSSLACLGVCCKPASRAGRSPPADAGTLVTVYVPARAAERLMSRFSAVASRHSWTLSVRTDSAALTEADLVVVDSAGTLVGRLRPGSRVATQARTLAEAALP